MPKEAIAQDTNVQADTDRNRKPVPTYVTEASGNGTVESFTVIYGRGGEIEHGVVILRTAANERALARVPVQDQATLAFLMDQDKTPVGSSGAISKAADGVLEWRKAS
jgi:acetyl-CoA C-acetyltransferase